MRKPIFVCLFVGMCAMSSPSSARAAEWFVAPGGTGAGSSGAPLGRIQQALDLAQPGDTITVRAGTYSETIRSVRGGRAGLPIRLRAAASRGSVVVAAAGRVLTVDHPYLIVEGLVLDGKYGASDTVDVNSGAHFLVLRNIEVKRSSRDLIDMSAPQGVLIENSLIHHALNPVNGRSDAHGIVAGAVQDLTVRNTQIHTFSGDGIQVDPGRAAPGWNRVTLEGLRIWLAPLPTSENGFPAGMVPGENAVDTKASPGLRRSTMTIRDTIAYGFGGGVVSNMAAFNLKENVEVMVDRVTVYNSEIGFRLRGPTSSTPAGALVTIQNAVIHSVATAFRYEDNIERLRIWNSTLGRGITRSFQAASSTSTGLNVRNLLILGSKPSQAADDSNLGVGADAFVDAAAHNYELAPGSAAIDAGTALSSVSVDRNGLSRPQGLSHDVGAYESRAPAGGGGGSADDAVVHARSATMVAGRWEAVEDATAARGMRVWHRNAGASRRSGALASPVDYFEVVAWVQAGQPYRLWVRGKADSNSRKNDSAFVQFSNAVDAAGKPIYRIGTTSSTYVNLEDCDGCGLSGWGWQDNGSGARVLGPAIRFAASGMITIRVQTAEDGLSVDQILLSPSTYLSTAPGSTKDDKVIVPES